MSRGTTHPKVRGRGRRRDTRYTRHEADRIYREALSEARAARDTRTLCGTALRPGAIVRAWVDYSDGTGWKARPVIVIASTARGACVVPCTSSSTGAFHGGLELQQRETTGLRARTWALVRKPLLMPRSHLLEMRGECHPHDLELVASAVRDQLPTMRAMPVMDETTGTTPGST